MLAVTLGARGNAIVGRSRKVERIIPTAAREVFDVSGATRDTVIASLTLALAAGQSFEKSRRIC